MIERGILPEGTELTPLNPMPEGTFSPGDVTFDVSGDPYEHAETRIASMLARD